MPSRYDPDAGDFRPPADYAFEPELRGEPPRKFPRHLLGNHPTRERVDLLSSTIMCGSLLILAVYFSINMQVGRIEFFVIIVGMMLTVWVACWVFVRHYLGPNLYLRIGVPIVVRVQEITLIARRKFGGQSSTSYRYRAVIQYLHPDYRQPYTKVIYSLPLKPEKGQYRKIAYKRGDYATGVYLPPRVEESLQLYAFLGVRNEIGTVAEANKPTPLHSAYLRFALKVFAVAIVLYMTITFVLTRGMAPIAVPGLQLIASFFVAGLILFGLLLAAHRRDIWYAEQFDGQYNEIAVNNGDPPLVVERHPHTRFVSAVARMFVFAACGICGLMLSFWVNAFFDRSEPRYVKVKVAVVDNRSVQLRLWNCMNFPVTLVRIPEPDRLQFINDQVAMAGIKPGLFGWKWVSGVNPVSPDD